MAKYITGASVNGETRKLRDEDSVHDNELQGAIDRANALVTSAQLMLADVSIAVEQKVISARQEITEHANSVSKTIPSDYSELSRDVNNVVRNNSFNFLEMVGNFSTVVNAGVTYTWDADHRSCIVNGTATDYSIDRVIRWQDRLTPFEHGKRYLFQTKPTPNVYVAVYFYRDGELIDNPIYLAGPTWITIPEDVGGIQVRLGVVAGKTANNEVIPFEILNALSNEELQASVEAAMDDVQRIDGETIKIKPYQELPENLDTINQTMYGLVSSDKPVSPLPDGVNNGFFWCWVSEPGHNWLLQEIISTGDPQTRWVRRRSISGEWTEWARQDNGTLRIEAYRDIPEDLNTINYTMYGLVSSDKPVSPLPDGVNNGFFWCWVSEPGHNWLLQEIISTGDPQTRWVRRRSISGEWTEWAEATEAMQGRFDSVINQLLEHNSINLVQAFGEFTLLEYNGVKYSWNDDHTVCTLTGASNGYSYSRMYLNRTGLGPFKAGKTYDLQMNSSNPEHLTVAFIYYKNGEMSEIHDVYAGTSRKITIPADADGIQVRIQCAADYDFTGQRIEVRIFNAPSNAVLAEDVIALNNDIEMAKTELGGNIAALNEEVDAVKTDINMGMESADDSLRRSEERAQEARDGLYEIRPAWHEGTFGLSDGKPTYSKYLSNVAAVIEIPADGLSVTYNPSIGILMNDENKIYLVYRALKKTENGFEFDDATNLPGSNISYTTMVGFIPHKPGLYVAITIAVGNGSSAGFDVTRNYIKLWSGRVKGGVGLPGVEHGFPVSYMPDRKRYAVHSHLGGSPHYPACMRGWISCLRVQDVQRVICSADYVMCANVFRVDEDGWCDTYTTIGTPLYNETGSSYPVYGTPCLDFTGLGIDEGIIILAIMPAVEHKYADGRWTYSRPAHGGLADYIRVMESVRVEYKPGVNHSTGHGTAIASIIAANLRTIASCEFPQPINFVFKRGWARNGGSGYVPFTVEKGQTTMSFYGGINSGQVFNGISPQRYATMAQNPNSRLYTNNGWYPNVGMQCIGFANALSGIKRKSELAAINLGLVPNIKKTPIDPELGSSNFDGIAIGDWLAHYNDTESEKMAGHVVVVVDAQYVNGGLFSITTVEAMHPFAMVRTYYNFSNFVALRDNVSIPFEDISVLASKYKDIVRYSSSAAEPIRKHFNFGDFQVGALMCDRGTNGLYTLDLATFQEYGFEDGDPTDKPAHAVEYGKYINISCQLDVSSFDIFRDGSWVATVNIPADVTIKNGLKYLSYPIGKGVFDTPGRFELRIGSETVERFRIVEPINNSFDGRTVTLDPAHLTDIDHFAVRLLAEDGKRMLHIGFADEIVDGTYTLQEIPGGVPFSVFVFYRDGLGSNYYWRSDDGKTLCG